MLSVLVQNIGGWVESRWGGRVFGLRLHQMAAHDAGAQATTTVRHTVTRDADWVEAAAGSMKDEQQQRAASPGAPQSTARTATSADPAASSPIQPEAVAGTDPGLRETARRSLVPRWLAALRTQTFTALAGVGLMVFGGLAALVTGGMTANLDLAATQTVQGVGLPWFGPLMLGISLPGFFPQSVLLIAGVALLFWRSGYRTETKFALAASASAIITEVVKRIVARPRPDAGLVSVVEGATGHSFPSGHTLFYVTFFGFLAYLAYAQLKPGRLRTAVLWGSGLLILLVGPSRIWMGQHWASDVLASYALGLTYLVGLVWVYGRSRLGTGATQPAV
jgi:membrane-associated phospholipid phosphatase